MLLLSPWLINGAQENDWELFLPYYWWDCFHKQDDMRLICCSHCLSEKQRLRRRADCQKLLHMSQFILRRIKYTKANAMGTSGSQNGKFWETKEISEVVLKHFISNTEISHLENTNVIRAPIPSRREKMVRKDWRLARMNKHFKQDIERKSRLYKEWKD